MISNLVKACGEPFAQNNEKVYLTFTTAWLSNMHGHQLILNIFFTVYNTTIHSPCYFLIMIEVRELFQGTVIINQRK